MPDFNPSDLANWCSGEWTKLPETTINGFSIDTRNLGEGELFVAIKDNRDGHEFLDLAEQRGACGALVTNLVNDRNIPQLISGNSLTALQAIAQSHREKFHGKVVGITGSCGKTSTKDILTLLLGYESTHSTDKNLNNHLGVPLTLLGIDPLVHKHSVVEAGINQTNEMGVLAKMISPNIAIITNVGSSHLEGLISEDIVAKEKFGLIREAKDLNLAIFPEHCLKFEEFYNFHKSSDNRSIVLYEGKPPPEQSENEAYFQFRTETNITGNSGVLRLWRTGFPVLNLEVPPVSRGMGSNLALALIAATELGLSEDIFFERLPQYTPSSLRGRILQGRGRTYYVDCYNANPSSMKDSILFFTETNPNRPRLLVLGGMEELGDEEKLLHSETGAGISLEDGDLALMIGEKASWIAAGMVQNGVSEDQILLLNEKEDARPVIEDFDGAVLFKGSRKSGLETLVPSWAI